MKRNITPFTKVKFFFIPSPRTQSNPNKMSYGPYASGVEAISLACNNLHYKPVLQEPPPGIHILHSAASAMHAGFIVAAIKQSFKNAQLANCIHSQASAMPVRSLEHLLIPSPTLPIPVSFALTDFIAKSIHIGGYWCWQVRTNIADKLLPNNKLQINDY